ncbi:MAG: SDR family NAD(P)-dependent oxidoreductase, partial [Clostridia bacterium]|nr:SDR family NAD(P)-dependent oxidoreductase [Clostridia bacterium]
MFDLTGKRALVTGSTQGIGFDIAKTLAEHGATVFVHGASNVEKCTNASKRIAGSIPVLANLLTVEKIDALYEETGDVDILVLNASIQ